MAYLTRLLVLFPLLSAAWAADEVSVERDSDAVIVRSPISQANFLFRAPPEFTRVEAPEGWAVVLEAAGEGGATARIRLRLGPSPARLDAFLEGREKEYAEGYGKKVAVSGEGGRRVATVSGKTGVRAVLVVVDGMRLYELFCEASPAGGTLAAATLAVVDGFTILDPKGAPAVGRASSGELKAKTIEHAYYRLNLLKPDGFSQEEVDPDADKGIFLHLRREDEQKNLCDIHVRVFLTRTMKKSVEFKAQKRIDQFRQKHPSARGAKKPKRMGYRASEAAYKCKLVGKMAKSGIVIEEEWRFIKHSNGRTYEVQLTTYGGAAREWKKEIAAFWKRFKIQPK